MQKYSYRISLSVRNDIRFQDFARYTKVISIARKGLPPKGIKVASRKQYDIHKDQRLKVLSIILFPLS